MTSHRSSDDPGPHADRADPEHPEATGPVSGSEPRLALRPRPKPAATPTSDGAVSQADGFA